MLVTETAMQIILDDDLYNRPHMVATTRNISVNRLIITSATTTCLHRKTPIDMALEKTEETVAIAGAVRETPGGCVMGGMNATRYQIEPRPSALGEGWQLRLFDTDPETGQDVEMGGGVFPASAYGTEEDASKDAYADAMQTGQDRLDSRPGKRL